MDSLNGILVALLPSIGVGAIFFFAIHFILKADKNERKNLQKLAQSDQFNEATPQD